jgi:hypothetical protein
MLQGRKIYSIETADNKISAYRGLLRLMRKSGGNSTFDSQYLQTLNNAVALETAEVKRLEAIVKKAMRLSKRQLG